MEKRTTICEELDPDVFKCACGISKTFPVNILQTPDVEFKGGRKECENYLGTQYPNQSHPGTLNPDASNSVKLNPNEVKQSIWNSNELNTNQSNRNEPHESKRNSIASNTDKQNPNDQNRNKRNSRKEYPSKLNPNESNPSKSNASEQNPDRQNPNDPNHNKWTIRESDRSKYTISEYVTGERKRTGCVECLLEALSIFFVILFFPASIFFIFRVVAEYERAVVFRLGRLRAGAPRGPGVIYVLPCIDDYTKLDLRTVSFDVPPQEALTRDSVTVRVDAVVYYRIGNPVLAIVAVDDYNIATQVLAATTLRNVLGTRNLSEALSDRENIAHHLQVILDEATDPWGITVERVEIKDVRLPISLQRAMAAEAEATREARAKLLAAEGEMKASRTLKEASDVLSQNPTAMQIRYLQTLRDICAERPSTVVFPLPIDMITSFTTKS